MTTTPTPITRASFLRTLAAAPLALAAGSLVAKERQPIKVVYHDIVAPSLAPLMEQPLVPPTRVSVPLVWSEWKANENSEQLSGTGSFVGISVAQYEILPGYGFPKIVHWLFADGYKGFPREIGYTDTIAEARAIMQAKWDDRLNIGLGRATPAPAPAPATVEVKPLVWIPETGCFGEKRLVGFTGDIRHFTIGQYLNGDHWICSLYGAYYAVTYPTLEAAKAAVESAWQTQVRSLIVAS